MEQKREEETGLDLLKLFRMPWSMSDNAFSWLEPTRSCDLDCEYCYQEHDPRSHKSLEEFEEEVRGLLRLRRSDAVFIAGGEPLTHPRIVEIVRLVRSYNVKVLLLTNGQKLTPELVHELRVAGLKGFVFHVDKCQNRPGWEDKSEKEINGLRQMLADMVYDEGGMVCGYNTTIVPDTLHEVRDIFEWTVRNIHKVQMNVIIPVRMPHEDDPYDYYVGGEKVELRQTPIGGKQKYRDMTAMELYDEMLKAVPDFTFNSYLGGTIRSDVPKWLFGNTIGTPTKVYGNLGPRTMELVQTAHHLAKGKYLSILRPWQYRAAQMLFLLAPFDRELRKTLKAYIKSIGWNVGRVFQPLYVQTIVVMQPHDVLDNGEQDLCDGCPNKTFWKGRLVSECRMEEHIRFGRLMTMVRKRSNPDA